MGALAFDLWAVNYRPRQITLFEDEKSRAMKLAIFDFSGCFADTDWRGSLDRYVDPCHKVKLSMVDEKNLRGWIARIRDIDMNPLWQLAFDIPPSWYGSNQRKLFHILDGLEMRRGCLSSEVDRLIEQFEIMQRYGPRHCTHGKCVAALACAIPEQAKIPRSRDRRSFFANK
jgi:hypothetical protein